MSKYLIEFPNHNASIVVEFNEEGNHINSVIDYGAMPADKIESIQHFYPLNLNKLTRLRGVRNVVIKTVEMDITFDAFWTAYAHKIGNKSRSEKLWKALSDADKTKAIVFIAQYERFLVMNAGTSKKYPETYLSQQIWNN